MPDDDLPIVVVVGPLGSGKTCLTQFLCYGDSLDSLSTISPLCYRCDSFVIWDTPGDDRYSWSYEPLLERSDLVLYCVSLEDPANKPDRLDSYKIKSKDVMVVYTKCDLEQALQRASELQQHRDECWVVSSKTGLGMAQLGAEISRRVLKRTQEQGQRPQNLVDLNDNNIKNKSPKKCVL